MEVTYTSTREDVVNFYRDWERYKSTPEAQKQYISRWMILLPLAIALVATGLGVHSVLAIMGFIFLGIALQRLVMFWYRRYLLNWMAKMPGVLGPATTRLDEDGVFYRDTFAEWKVFWASVTDVVQTTDLIHIFTLRDSHISVPRRAFESEEQWHGFYNLAVARWKDEQAPTA